MVMGARALEAGAMEVGAADAVASRTIVGGAEGYAAGAELRLGAAEGALDLAPVAPSVPAMGEAHMPVAGFSVV